MIQFIWHSRNENLHIRTENRLVAARGCGDGLKDLLQRSTEEFGIGGDGTVLYLDCIGDSMHLSKFIELYRVNIIV